ncbi:MAG: nucleotidyltransferase family protein [Lachnospiraceae bacterium]|nr:nucleotidyltransferase family protein [Lachnospiraceae bacterium]
MKTAAIICEYNPFHNGHAYQIDYIKKNTDTDRIIAIISGDFVQRGEPAVICKEARTRMALEAGVDAVFLLPVVYSTGSADMFAKGAVTIACGLNADYLCFGSECGDIAALQEAASILSKEGNADSPKIKEKMSEGLTFAKARALSFPEYEKILSSPNNVLGIEYIIAGQSMNAGFKYITHKRVGAAYNDLSINTDSDKQSATALRSIIRNGKPDDIKPFVPECAFNILRGEIVHNRVLTSDNFSDILFAKLMNMDENEQFLEVSPDLYNRIKNLLPAYKGFEDFVDSIKAKNHTRTGLMRALTHILLNIHAKPSNTIVSFKDVSKLAHVRLLGFREDHADVLTHIKKTGTLNIVSKVPDVLQSLDSFNKALFDQDLCASTLYDYAITRKESSARTPEYSKPVIKV